MRVASVRAQAKSYAALGEMESDFRRAIDPRFTGREQGVLWHRCAASGVIEGEPFAEIAARVPRAGAYELACRADVPARVVMSEYVDVAGAFVDDEETGMVNAVLDQLAHQMRAAEFDRA